MSPNHPLVILAVAWGPLLVTLALVACVWLLRWQRRAAVAPSPTSTPDSIRAWVVSELKCDKAIVEHTEPGVRLTVELRADDARYHVLVDGEDVASYLHPVSAGRRVGQIVAQARAANLMRGAK